MAVVKGDTFVQEVRVDDLSSQAMQKIAGAAKGLQGTFGKLGASVVVVNQAWELSSRVLRRLNVAFKSVVGGAIDFEKAMAEVMTLIDSSAGVTAKLTDEVLALQSRYGTNQADIAKAYYQAISSGAVDATTASNLMNTAQKLAIGGVTDLSTAVDGLTTIINAYGLSADEAVNVSDALFIGMKAGKTTIGELSMSLGQAASFASSMGVTFEELVSGVSALTTGGVQTTTAITQVRAALIALSKPSSELQEIYRRLNITSIQAAIKQHGLVKVLKMVQGQSDGSAESLAKLFSRTEAINAVTALTSDAIGSKFNAILGDMKLAADDAGAATDDAFKIIENTTSQRLERAYGKIASFKTRSGLAFKDLYADIIERAVSAIKYVEAFNKALASVNWKNMIDGATDAAKAIVALTVALAALNAGKTATVLNTLATSMVSLAKTIAVASAPIILLSVKIGLIAAGVTTAAIAIDIFVRNLDRIPDIVNASISAIERFVVQVSLAISRLVLGLVLQIEKAAALLNKFGVLPDSTIASFRTNIVAMSDAIDSLETPIDRLDARIESLTENIDMGFGAKIFAEAKKFLASFNKELSKTEGMSAVIADNLGDIKPVVEPEKASAMRAQVPLFSTEDISLIQGTFGDAASSMASSASSMAAVPLAFMQAANVILDAVQKLLDIVPQLINKIANIFRSVADLPTKIAEAFQNLFDSVMYLVENGEKMVTDMALKLADLVWDLPDALFTAFEKMLDGMEEMGAKWGEALAKMDIVLLALRFVTAIIKAVPRIVKAFANNIGPMAMAFGDALALTIKQTINDLAAALGLNKPFNIALPDLEKEMGNLGAKISKSASDVFKVTELEAATRGTDLADRIRNAIDSSMNKGKNIFDQIAKKLKELWLWIYDEILLPIYDIVKKAWLWVYNEVIMPIYNIVRDAWLWVWNEVIMPIYNIIRDAWLWVWKEVILKMFDKLGELIGGIGAAISKGVEGVVNFIASLPEKISSAFKAVFDKLGELIGGIGSAISGAVKGVVEFITNLPAKVSAAFTSVFDFFKNLKFSLPALPQLKVATPDWLDKLKIEAPSWLSSGGITIPGSSQIFGKISDAYKRSDAGKVVTSVAKSVTSVGKSLGLATGGMALPEGKWLNGKLYAQGGAIAQGTDTIDAKLTPGEFVINREAARANIGLLSFINSSKAPVSPVQSPTNISIVINARTDLSAEQIRREVIPTLEKELRAKSQQGRFMLATTGLRT